MSEKKDEEKIEQSEEDAKKLASETSKEPAWLNKSNACQGVSQC
jgi:hypothetical protein